MATALKETQESTQERERLRYRRAKLDHKAPLAGVHKIAGVRVYDVGQGDAIAMLDQDLKPVLQVDYGGRQGSPFVGQSSEWVDDYMPVDRDRLVMMTHWDEDHWSSAPRGRAAFDAHWLVPRQVTSPRAVRFAASVPRMTCISEDLVGQAVRFATSSGDEIWWEKIGASEPDASKYEDCNRTGVALSVLHRDEEGAEQVILIPGDAPFGRVSHYLDHADQPGRTLTGIVAFHHGAGTHWTSLTKSLLEGWNATAGKVDVVFSCADPNCYNHPERGNYTSLLVGRLGSVTETPHLRRSGRRYHDLLFR